MPAATVALDHALGQRLSPDWGAFIRQRRTEQNLSQFDLAVLVGVVPPIVSVWERQGAVRLPRPDLLRKLAAALDVEPATLFAIAMADPAAPTEL